MNLSCSVTFTVLDRLLDVKCASVRIDAISGGEILENRKAVKFIQYERPESRERTQRFSKRLSLVSSKDAAVFATVSFLDRLGNLLCKRPLVFLPDDANAVLESKALKFLDQAKWKPCPCYWVTSDLDPFSIGPDEADIEIDSLTITQTGSHTFDVHYTVVSEPAWLTINKVWTVYQENNLGDMDVVPVAVTDVVGSKTGVAHLTVGGPGQFEVVLEVDSNSACVKAEREFDLEDDDDVSFKVFVSNTVITAKVDPCNYLKYTFKDSSVDSNGLWSPGFNLTWSVKDSQGNTLAIGSPSGPVTFDVTFPGQGTYVVYLAADDPLGGPRPTGSYTVTVNSNPTTVDFGYKWDSCPQSNFVTTFTNFSSGLNGCPGQWAWDFGDGHTSTSAEPQHTYANAGTYQVSLTFTSTAGQVTKIVKTIVIYQWVPSINYEVCLDGSVIYWTSDGWSWSEALFGPWDVDERRNWDFPGGDPKGISWRSASKVKVCYPHKGQYTASLMASNMDGARCSSTVTVEVQRVTGGCCKKEKALIDFPQTYSGKDYRFKSKLKFNGKRRKIVGFIKSYRKVGTGATYVRRRVASINCYLTGKIWFQASNSQCECNDPLLFSSANTIYSKKSKCRRKLKLSKKFRARQGGIAAHVSLKIDANHNYADTISLPQNDCGC